MCLSCSRTSCLVAQEAKALPSHQVGAVILSAVPVKAERSPEGISLPAVL